MNIDIQTKYQQWTFDIIEKTNRKKLLSNLAEKLCIETVPIRHISWNEKGNNDNK